MDSRAEVICMGALAVICMGAVAVICMGALAVICVGATPPCHRLGWIPSIAAVWEVLEFLYHFDLDSLSLTALHRQHFKLYWISVVPQTPVCIREVRS